MKSNTHFFIHLPFFFSFILFKNKEINNQIYFIYALHIVCVRCSERICSRVSPYAMHLHPNRPGLSHACSLISAGRSLVGDFSLFMNAFIFTVRIVRNGNVSLHKTKENKNKKQKNQRESMRTTTRMRGYY